MEIGEKANNLISKWKQERPQYDKFVSDGILNYSNYDKQNPKILFLLKEANADFVNIAPLEKSLNGYGPRGNSDTFWRYMRGYEYVIKTAWNKLLYNENEVLKKKELPNNNSAYVNIKKQCDNKSTSDNKEIQLYANNDKELLIEQIDLINPDIIYCAGTFDSYKILNKEIKELSPKVYQSNKRIVLDYYHLAHREGYKTFRELYDLMSKVDFNI